MNSHAVPPHPDLAVVETMGWALVICGAGLTYYTPMGRQGTIPSERLPSAGGAAIRRPSPKFPTTVRDAERAW